MDKKTEDDKALYIASINEFRRSTDGEMVCEKIEDFKNNTLRPFIQGVSLSETEYELVMAHLATIAAVIKMRVRILND